MADHQFEQKVSQQLADFKLKPNTEVWQQVEKQLEEDKKRRRWFFYLPLAALVIGGLLYAVWPEEKPGKKDVAVQSNTNNSATTTVEKNTNELPLTKTESSTITANEAPTSEKEANENNLESPVTTIQPIQRNSNVTKPNRHKVTTHNTNTIALTTKEKSKNEVVVDKTTDKKETSVENTTAMVDTKQMEEKKDSALVHQPVVNKTDSVQANEPSTIVVDSINKKPSVQAPIISKKKWQTGLSISAGTSDIRGSLFPGSGTKSLYFSDAFAPTGSNNGGQGGVTRIVQYEYTVRPSFQMGTGIMLRKPFKKRNAFVTGLQYQYSSYSVTQRQRIDTFILANNYFSNISTKEKEVQFSMHALNLPLEMEFKIADIKKGALLFNAGIHNWVVVSSTQTDSLSAFRYAAESSRSNYSSGGSGSSTVKETEATTWQPQLYLSPAFEWKGKKASSQLGLYLDYGLRRAYQSSSKDYWWQTGIRYRIFFQTKK